MDIHTATEVSYKNGYEKGFQDGIKQQQAEIERLKKKLDDKCDICIEREKTEAYKEFADRLKEKEEIVKNPFDCTM